MTLKIQLQLSLQLLFYFLFPFWLQNAKHNRITATAFSERHVAPEYAFYRTTNAFHGSNTKFIAGIGPKLNPFHAQVFKGKQEQ
jgi:hypothetical protein